MPRAQANAATLLVFSLWAFAPQTSALAHSTEQPSAAPSSQPDPPVSTMASAGMEEQTQPSAPRRFADRCNGSMEVWDVTSNMCMPLAMPGMPMSMTMVHGNAFGVYTVEQGPRGRHALAAPNMLMLDAGTSVGASHYVNVDLMATAERWLFPEAGYPELLQIGETNAHGVPFIDAQHPHSSPIMGLTFSDTIRLGEGKNYLKLFVAPRGESTDGPIAFMHRPTGAVNPDAPLGHHVGQDVGHISSSVLGASLKVGGSRLEVSTFNGREPEPSQVDLPVGRPDSYAARFIQAFGPSTVAMVSAAYVNRPEPASSASFETRYSASIYGETPLGEAGTFDDAFIFGLIHHLDDAPLLSSYAYEFLWRDTGNNLWGRFEALQRTPAQLQVKSLEGQNRGRFIGATTLGYTRDILQAQSFTVGIGASATRDFLPGDYRPAYGGEPWTGKAFVQIQGMTMGS